MIVLDACAAAEMALQTPRGEGFRCLVEEGEPIITSTLFHAEIRNTFWKYVSANMTTEYEAEALVNKALSLVDEFVPIEENAAESFMEATRLNHPIYDLLYATIARRNAATLFTADKKLVALCNEMGINCVDEVAF